MPGILSEPGETGPAKGDAAIPIEIAVTILLLLPLLAAVVLTVFAVALIPLRKIPAHEYQQLVRAPAWVVVVVGGGLFALSLIALAMMSGHGLQLLIGTRHQALLMIDAYGLWGSALLGAVLAVAAWVPAACRAFLPRAIPAFLVVLLCSELALLLLFSQQLRLSLLCWVLLLAVLCCFYAVLFRPSWRWDQLELFVVLMLAGGLGGTGLFWLRGLAQGSDLTGMWSVLLSSPPQETNGAVLLLAIGWLSPAIYLPWWAWSRRGEPGTVWLPAAMMLAVAGVLALVRIVFFIFPAGGGDFAQIPGVEHLFLIKRILVWLQGWGLLALLLGAGWLGYQAVRRRRGATAVVFRPLLLVASGMLLLGLAGGILGMAAGQPERRADALNGLLWSLMTWAGVVTVWLASGNLLPALTVDGERSERRIVWISCWATLAALVAVPPFTGFRAVADCWTIWQHSGTPPWLVLSALVITAVGTALQLPRWARAQAAARPIPGSGWGVIGPFLLTLALLACGLFGSVLSPLFTLIRQSLLQVY